jgi:hypothetical protein
VSASDDAIDPLLKRIYESWKADGHKVTLETRADGSLFIRVHPPGEWRPFACSCEDEAHDNPHCPQHTGPPA